MRNKSKESKYEKEKKITKDKTRCLYMSDIQWRKMMENIIIKSIVIYSLTLNIRIDTHFSLRINKTFRSFLSTLKISKDSSFFFLSITEPYSIL